MFIFLIHLFGDISSPILLGWISGLVRPSRVWPNSPIGRFFAFDRGGPDRPMRTA